LENSGQVTKYSEKVFFLRYRELLGGEDSCVESPKGPQSVLRKGGGQLWGAVLTEREGQKKGDISFDMGKQGGGRGGQRRFR